jgi:predicted DNA-binding antitoxin AbrB/MazE fold protein
MYAVKAIYDGNLFRLEEPVPVKEKYEVVITFTKPVKKSQENILKYFNTWDEEDVKCIENIVNERENFFPGRSEKI